MDAFSVVLIIACLIFIIVYFYRQWKKYKDEKDKATWPREFTDCPDYWTNEGQHVCRNVFNLGDCRQGSGQDVETVDFKTEVGGISANDDVIELRRQMNTKDALEKKCRWAKRCNITWEGINKVCA